MGNEYTQEYIPMVVIFLLVTVAQTQFLHVLDLSHTTKMKCVNTLFHRALSKSSQTSAKDWNLFGSTLSPINNWNLRECDFAHLLNSKTGITRS